MLTDGQAQGEQGGQGPGTAGDSGQGTAGFMAHVPQDLQGVPMFQQFAEKGLGDFMRHAHSLSQEVGRRIPADRAIQLPDAADREGWDTVLAKLRPQGPADYQFKAPEALGWDDQALEGIKQGFWDAKLNDLQAQAVVDFLAEGSKLETAAEQQALEQQKAADEQALRQKFGYEYDARMEVVDRVLRQFGAKDHLAKIGVDKDPVLIPLLAQLGQGMMEGRFHEGKQQMLGGSPGGESLERVEAELKVLRESPEFQRGDVGVNKKIEELTRRKVEALNRQAASKASGY